MLIMMAPIAAVLVHKHLAADGSHYLLQILDGRSVIRHAWSRQYANDITQWPVVLAISLGLRDVHLLSYVFGLGIVSLYPLSFLACVVAVRGERPILLIFPLISIAGVNLPASGILCGESHAMVLLAWPILFLAIRRAQLTPLEVGLLWFLLLLFTRVYEASLLPSLLFGGIFFLRLSKSEKMSPADRQRSLWTWSVALLMSLAAISIAAYFIANPISPANKSSFARDMFRMIRNPQAVVALAVAIGLSLGFATRRLVWLWISIAPIGFLFVLMVTGRGQTLLGDSFQARSLSLFLLPLLLVLALMVSRVENMVPRMLPMVLCAYLFFAASYEIASLPRWAAYLNNFRQELASNEGLVPLASTDIGRGWGQWYWTNPTISVLLQSPCVRTIVQNDPSVDWQPFDPSQRLVLQDYVAYGPALHPIDPKARLCD